MLQGGLASVLAVAGLVAFATEASAHNNFFQSVTGACNSSPGTGATLTWTLYNDWNQTETGTFSTAQGTLSTHRPVHPSVPDGERDPARRRAPDVHPDADRPGAGGTLAQLDHQRALERHLVRLDAGERDAEHDARCSPSAERLRPGEDDADHHDDAGAAQQHVGVEQLGGQRHRHG